MAKEVEKSGSKEVATRVVAAAPAPIEAADVGIPQLKIGQPGTPQVLDGVAPLGSLFTVVEPNDPDPTVLYKNGDKAPLDIHPLKVGKSWVWYDEDKQRHDEPWGSPSVNADAMPYDALTYEYTLLVPVYDRELPMVMRIKGTSVPTAQKINLTIKRHEPRPPWTLALSLWTAQRSNAKGRWFVPQIAITEAKPAHVAAAERVALLLGVGRLADAEALNDAEPDVPVDAGGLPPEPSIEDKARERFGDDVPFS